MEERPQELFKPEVKTPSFPKEEKTHDPSYKHGDGGFTFQINRLDRKYNTLRSSVHKKSGTSCLRRRSKDPTNKIVSQRR